MIPFKDENPTYRPALVNYALIVANIAVFIFLQGPAASTADQLDFTLEWAAVPCEITTGRPLTQDEVVATFTEGQDEACGVDLQSVPGNEPFFADKLVFPAAVFSMFLHGGWLHLGGNMLYLWIFGNNIEDRLGAVKYLVFYLVGGLVAAAAHIYAQPDSTIPVVGASGAVAAVMGAYLAWYPAAPVRTFIFLYLRDISAGWLLGFWFISQFFIGSNSGIAWLAHVGGFVFGVGFGLLLRSAGSLRRLLFTPEYRHLDHWDNTGGIGPGQYREGYRLGSENWPPGPQPFP